MSERTEAATPKRLADAREKGQIPRSRELSSALTLLGSVLAVQSLGGALAGSVTQVVRYGLLAAGTVPVDAASAVVLVRHVGLRSLAGMGGFLAALSGLALAVGGVQARGVLTTHPLAPDLSRLNPLPQLKRLLGSEALVELLRSLLKLTVVGGAIYGVLAAAWGDTLSLAQRSPIALLEVVRGGAVRLLTRAGLAYLALAALDYGYQLWRHSQQMRMTKQEVKEEARQSDGDPMVKARQRSMARSMLRRQMFKEVPTADVVVTNPTHIAVALRYDPERADAPVVLAMGQRLIAQRIKAVALEAGVPLVENRPLARALLRRARVGDVIPPELYVAVAEVLAYVIRQRAQRPSGWAGSTRA